jgi:hypothetical protein
MNTDDASFEGRFREIKRVKDEVADSLLRIPGVNGVGIGEKITNDQPTGERAIRVFLTRKKPLDEVPSGEIVPPEIQGIKTDVDELGPITPIAADQAKYRPLRGGIQVEGGTWYGTFGSGTMGCLARTTGPNPQVVLLTNQHVLFENGNTEPLGREAGQPILCSICSACCSEAVGHVSGARLTEDVDGAIAALNPGSQWYAEIHEVGPVAGVYPITDAEGQSQTYQVQKRGRTTRLTRGIVLDSTFDFTRLDGHKFSNQIVIRQEGFPTFAEPGDSGSVILNRGREVIGLLHSAVDDPREPGFGWGFASPIAKVQEALQIQIASTTTAGKVEHVPALPGNGSPSPNPGPVTSQPGPVGGQPIRVTNPSHLRQAQFDILQTIPGQLYAQVVSRHQQEVRLLINTNKRVATVWHRNGGPTIVQEIMRAIEEPDRPLPATVGNRPLVDCFHRILAIFTRYGSESLRSDLLRYGPPVTLLVGLSYNQVLARLRAGTILRANRWPTPAGPKPFSPTKG